MRIELPAHKRWVYSSTMPVRWGDMDAMGHVNNTVYFRYMEQLRIEWFYQVGFSPAVGGVGPVVVNGFCNYLRELAYPDEIRLQLYVSDPARTTFETWVTMERVDAPGVLCATGGATIIWVDSQRKKAVDLPASVRGLISGNPVVA